MIGRFLCSLRRDDRGSAAVEFALIGPALIGMMFGVLQVGIGMQNYNALRGAAGDVARYAVVNYQTANRLTDTQLTNYARTVATGSPYGLISDRLTASVAPATTQRVAGATEMTITYSYAVPTVLAVIGVGDIPISYSRPIFLVN